MNNVKNFRKKIFLNSQYCTYYFEGKTTVLAGIMRSFGYKYSIELPEEKLKQVNTTYRKFNAIMNGCVAFEIILYLYLFVFPNFTSFIKLPFAASVLTLALIPLVVLYFTYLGVNYLYENYLQRYIGTFQKTKFKPQPENVDEKAFENYEKTSPKSAYILGLILVLFFLYVFVPVWVENLNIKKQFNKVVNLSNIYLTFVPISAEVYANRAYAKFSLKQYKAAVTDYERANKYSSPDNFADDIVGVKTYYLPKEEMLKEFDKAIASEKEEPVKYLLKYEKATYLLKNNDYNSALNIYNEILQAYKNKKKVFFSPARAYYNRGVSKMSLGDSYGGKIDFMIAKRMCPECKFNMETTLVRRP